MRLCALCSSQRVTVRACGCVSCSVVASLIKTLLCIPVRQGAVPAWLPAVTLTHIQTSTHTHTHSLSLQSPPLYSLLFTVALSIPLIFSCFRFLSPNPLSPCPSCLGLFKCVKYRSLSPLLNHQKCSCWSIHASSLPFESSLSLSCCLSSGWLFGWFRAGTDCWLTDLLICLSAVQLAGCVFGGESSSSVTDFAAALRGFVCCLVSDGDYPSCVNRTHGQGPHTH